MAQQAEPPEIEHLRWRHKKLGYVVEVLGVYNHNDPPYYRTVVVDRTLHTKKKRMWSAQLFVKTFTPIGRRKRKARTLWDHL